ncbi:MAG TPA: SRPBCC domain-containing protein [Nitrososphaerales archaeon]|nr:SRPBCC domain-containing protein [Nitrososphaerales archaeon]
MSGWSSTAEIRKSIEIEAPPDVVYRALTDEKELVQWMPTEAKMDLRVGGAIRFKFHWEARNVDTEVEGTIEELVPGIKLSYTWAAVMRSDRDPSRMESAPAALVTWILDELPGGRTKVTLVQKGFDERFRHDGESGWEHFLGTLRMHCSGGSRS